MMTFWQWALAVGLGFVGGVVMTLVMLFVGVCLTHDMDCP